MVAKHNFLWQFPLDFENNIFKVAFHKIFHPSSSGANCLGAVFLCIKGVRIISEELFMIFA